MEGEAGSGRPHLDRPKGCRRRTTDWLWFWRLKPYARRPERL